MSNPSSKQRTFCACGVHDDVEHGCEVTYRKAKEVLRRLLGAVDCIEWDSLAGKEFGRLDDARSAARALLMRSPVETSRELERLRELQEKALALDDAVAEFGIDKPQYIAEAYQKFHDVLHDGHGSPSVVETGTSGCCRDDPGGGFVCTLPKGHVGQHEAYGTHKNLLQAWPAQKATRDPPGSYRDATGELVLPQVPVRCINFPCQLRAGHTGPCDSSPNGKGDI